MLKDKTTGRNKKILAEKDFMVTERDSLRTSVTKKIIDFNTALLSWRLQTVSRIPAAYLEIY